MQTLLILGLLVGQAEVPDRYPDTCKFENCTCPFSPHNDELHKCDDESKCATCAWNQYFRSRFVSPASGVKRSEIPIGSIYPAPDRQRDIELYRKTGKSRKDWSWERVQDPESGEIYDIPFDEYAARAAFIEEVGYVLKEEEPVEESEPEATIPEPPERKGLVPLAWISEKDRKRRLNPAWVEYMLLGLDASDGKLTPEELGRIDRVLERLSELLLTTTSWLEAKELTRAGFHISFGRGYKVVHEEDWTKWGMTTRRLKWFQQFDLRTIDNPLFKAMNVGFAGTPHAVGRLVAPYRIIRPEASKEFGFEMESPATIVIYVYKDQPKKTVYFRTENISPYSGKK